MEGPTRGLPGHERGNYNSRRSANNGDGPMDEDDLMPRNVKPVPKNLEQMSIEALEDYIAGLESEIDRARAVIADKGDARNEAEGFFRG